VVHSFCKCYFYYILENKYIHFPEKITKKRIIIIDFVQEFIFEKMLRRMVRKILQFSGQNNIAFVFMN